MPPNPSGSCSPRRPTPRSGSTTATRRRVAVAVAPPPPPAPRAAPARRLARGGIFAFLAAFVVVHVALDLYLDLFPGDFTGLPGTRLLELFVLWFPIALLAAFVGFGAPGRVPFVLRATVLAAYVMILVGLTLPLYGAPDTPCSAEPDRADCVASAWFDFLLRFAPIPALFFVFARGYGWNLSRCVGLALIFTFTWRSLHGSFPDLLVIAAGGGTPGPTPTIVFYRSFFLKVLWDVVYPLLGLLFFLERVPWVHARPAWGDQLKRILQPLGNWVRRSVPIDLAIGGLLFFANLIATSYIYGLLSRAATENVGDDSRVFDLLTLDQVFLLSIVAGVGEELIYRGLLQNGLERLLRSFRLPLRFTPLPLIGAVGAPLLIAWLLVPTAPAVSFPEFYATQFLAVAVSLAFIPFALWKGPATIAIFIQSIAFAIVHAGYTDLNHVILPYLFGIFMGVVYRLFGLLPAILIHVEIDILAFGDEFARSNPAQADGVYTFLGLLIMVNLVAGVIILLFAFLRWYEGRRRALAVLIRS